jgi:hypothetical protein
VIPYNALNSEFANFKTPCIFDYNVCFFVSYYGFKYQTDFDGTLTGGLLTYPGVI